MGRTKALLRVLFALALVAVMAVLPILAGQLQDRATLGQPALGQMQGVQLHFDRNLSGLGLLTLMERGEVWQIIEMDAASMTLDAVEFAARIALMEYQAAGLISNSLPFDFAVQDVYAVSTPTGLAGIVWSVVLTAKKGDVSMYEVYLNLDDTTGQVMSVNYGTEPWIPVEERRLCLETLAQVFFKQLGIEGYPDMAVDDLDAAYNGEGTVAQRYRFGDTLYGEVTVDLYVFAHGFYTSFTR